MKELTAWMGFGPGSFQSSIEGVVLWALCTVPAGAYLVHYLRKFRKQTRNIKQRHTEAKLLGADKAPAMFPQVDLSLCIGCGSCTLACPMGKVLGMVDGAPKVINGTKCIGIAKCAEACPVGAITMGLGNLKKRNDIPVMDADNETSLPGVYIAGELGGQGLIFNGINQGVKVVGAIHGKIQQGGRRGTREAYDLAIVGAGPAGIGAATMARKLGLRYILLDVKEGVGGTVAAYPKKKPTLIDRVEIPGYGFLDKYEYTKEELLEIFGGICKDQALNFRSRFNMAKLESGEGMYSVISDHGDIVKSAYVVLALGRNGTPRKLGVPGEELPKVAYRLEDPGDFKDKDIVVVGGGDSAVEAAIALAAADGNRVRLSYRKNKFFRLKDLNQTRLDQMVGTGKLNVIMETDVREIGAREIRIRSAASEEVYPNDAVFIFAGGMPPFKLLEDIGVRFHGVEANRSKNG